MSTQCGSNLTGLTYACNCVRVAQPSVPAVSDRSRKFRLQAYVDSDLYAEIKARAEAGYRPESWEVERLIRAGLEVTPIDANHEQVPVGG